MISRFSFSLLMSSGTGAVSQTSLPTNLIAVGSGFGPWSGSRRDRSVLALTGELVQRWQQRADAVQIRRSSSEHVLHPRRFLPRAISVPRAASLWVQKLRK